MDHSAALGEQKKKIYSEFEDDLMCVICRELMVHAHTLACSHSFGCIC